MENSLVNQLITGNHKAFRQIYLQWHQRVYYYFLKKVNSPEKAEDLVQLTFIKIWRYREKLSLEHPIEAQLFQTASIIWIDELRRRIRARQHEEISGYEGNLSDNTRHDIEFSNRQLLKSAISMLSPVRRKVFVLSKIEGYTYKEIAASLHISIKTVDNHIAQALKQLRASNLLMLVIYAIIEKI